MRTLLILCGICLGVLTSTTPAMAGKNPDGKKFPSLLAADVPATVQNWVDSMYSSMHLDSFGLKKDVFFYACKGYEYLLSQNKLQRTDVLTICDYSQLSNNKRLYVIDMAEGRVLFNTYVSHGKNSGKDSATSFSNRNNSHKSSLGFMVTGETYRGKSGYSMHFDGMEQGINDHVRMRNIVLHGSYYVNEYRADAGTLMGRSYGCPAVPYGEHEEIIDRITGGSCFFIYSPDYTYTKSSKILNAHFSWPISLLSASTVATPTAAASSPSVGGMQ
jgi:hypothetical protein